MNELDAFEAELRGVRPAAAPPELLKRLRTSAGLGGTGETPVLRGTSAGLGGTGETPVLRGTSAGLAGTGGTAVLRGGLLLWLIPAAAVLVLAGGVARVLLSPMKPLDVHAGVPLEARDVYVDRQFVGAFDAVARLPEGELLRVHCQEWVDELMWRDKSGTVTFKERTPRLEVVPVRFETD